MQNDNHAMTPSSRRRLVRQRSEDRTLRLTNLPAFLDEADVVEFFTGFELLAVHIVMAPPHRVPPYATVEFASEEDAHDAYVRKASAPLRGRLVTVEYNTEAQDAELMHLRSVVQSSRIRLAALRKTLHRLSASTHHASERDHIKQEVIEEERQLERAETTYREMSEIPMRRFNKRNDLPAPRAPPTSPSMEETEPEAPSPRPAPAAPAPRAGPRRPPPVFCSALPDGAEATARQPTEGVHPEAGWRTPSQSRQRRPPPPAYSPRRPDRTNGDPMTLATTHPAPPPPPPPPPRWDRGSVEPIPVLMPVRPSTPSSPRTPASADLHAALPPRLGRQLSQELAVLDLQRIRQKLGKLADQSQAMQMPQLLPDPLCSLLEEALFLLPTSCPAAGGDARLFWREYDPCGHIIKGKIDVAGPRGDFLRLFEDILPPRRTAGLVQRPPSVPGGPDGLLFFDWLLLVLRGCCTVRAAWRIHDPATGTDADFAVGSFEAGGTLWIPQAMQEKYVFTIECDEDCSALQFIMSHPAAQST